MFNGVRNEVCDGEYVRPLGWRLELNVSFFVFWYCSPTENKKSWLFFDIHLVYPVRNDKEDIFI